MKKDRQIEISNELMGTLKPDDINAIAQSKHDELKTFIEKWKTRYLAIQ
jgi:hypothetical protein